MIKKECKKGVSNIIATVLLVLFVIVSTGVLWTVVQYMVTGTSEQSSVLLKKLINSSSDGVEQEEVDVQEESEILFVDYLPGGDCLGNYSATDRQCVSVQTNLTSYRFIQSAANIVNPGDVINIRSGLYNEHVIFRRGGGANNYIIFKPYRDEKVTVRPGKNYSLCSQCPACESSCWQQDGNIYELTFNDLLSTPSTVSITKWNDYAVSEMNSSEAVMAPPAMVVGYNVFFYNTTTKNITVNLTSGRIEDLFVVDGIKRITILAPYIEIRNLIIEYSYDGIKPTWEINKSDFNHNGHYVRIINNTISHTAGQGILSGSDYLLIEGNDISYNGAYFSYRNTNYLQNSQDHALYLTGSHGIVRNNKMYNCRGACMHPWSTDLSYPKNYSIYGNWIEHGAALSGTDNKFYNNIVFNYTTFYPVSGYDILNNLFILTPTSGSAVHFGAWGGLYGVTFKNNIVLGQRGYCLEMHNTDLSRIDFDYNIYHNCTYFSIGSDEPAADWTLPRQIFRNFSSYKTNMSGYGLEQNSFEADPYLESNYALKENSPAIDVGSCIELSKLDYNEILRGIDGNKDGTEGCDMGPFEYVSS